MFWGALVLAIPALALGVAVWGVLRRKWYGLVPLLVVAIVGWLINGDFWEAADDFLEACANQSPVSEVMMLILAGGAAVMSLAALWAGWSRGFWFWRGLVFAGVPASLVPLEANELILVSLLSMPVLVAVAWRTRFRRDRLSRPAETDQATLPKSKGRSQFSLRNLLLAFVLLGVLATSVRSLLVGHVLLASWGLVWLAGSISLGALAAASPAIAGKTGRKWLIGSVSALAVAAASWQWLGWSNDPLGLATYFSARTGPLIGRTLLLEGELCFLTAVALVSTVYVIAAQSPWNQPSGKLWRCALAILLVAPIPPLAAIYPRMMALETTVTLLPPSQAYETVLLSARKIRDLESQNAPRASFLSALRKLDQAMPVAGHVTHDPAQFARERLYPGGGDDPKISLSYEIGHELRRAVYEGRDDDVLPLAKLQWRISETFYQGGTVEDFFYGYGSQQVANQAVAVVAPQLSDAQCAEALHQARALDRAEPAIHSVLAYDTYWQSVGAGWRDRLYDAALSLVGDQPNRRSQISEGTYNWRRQRLGSLKTVQYVLALELHHRKHGEFPERLETVQAAHDLLDLMDPYTDHPPVYRQVEDNYLLYSVGADGNDEGGLFSQGSNPRPNTGDINLVSDRATFSSYWQSYLQATGALPAPKPAPPK